MKMEDYIKQEFPNVWENIFKKLQVFLLHEEDIYKGVGSRSQDWKRYRSEVSSHQNKQEFVYYSILRQMCFLIEESLRFINEIQDVKSDMNHRELFSAIFLLCHATDEHIVLFKNLISNYDEKSLLHPATKKDLSQIRSVKKCNFMDWVFSKKKFNRYEIILKKLAEGHALKKGHALKGHSKDFRNLLTHRLKFWSWQNINANHAVGWLKCDLSNKNREQVIEELFLDIKGKEQQIESSAKSDFCSQLELIKSDYDKLLKGFKEALAELESKIKSIDFPKRFK
jgi:hypothetical protein